MKRTVLLFVLVLCCWGSFYGQTLTVQPSTIPPGYSGPLTFTGTGYNFTQSTLGFTLRLTHDQSGQQFNFGSFPGNMWFAPVFPYPPITSVNGNITLPANAPLGIYNVLLKGYGQLGTNDITSSYLLNVDPLPTYSHFIGKLVQDTDSNCVHNVGDVGLAGRLITITPGPYYALTDQNGEFDALLPPGTYTFTGPNISWGSYNCPAGGGQTATMNTHLGTVSGIDFYSKPILRTDLQSRLYVNIHRPGFTVNVTNHIYNASAVEALNVTALLIKPSFMSFNYFNVPPISVNGDTARFQISSLSPGLPQNFTANLQVPIVPLGTSYTYQASCTTSVLELSLFNNQVVVNGVVVGSYDPNDKRVWDVEDNNADGFIAPDDTLLRYMIRFQNTGTDTAFNIRIRDTLDADLETGSLDILGASHSYELLLNDSTGRAIEFFFPNILLLDSFQNEPLSHGFIEYTIRKRNGLPNGRSLDNTAAIYFDFNAPVITNTVHSVICPEMADTFGINILNGPQVGFNSSTGNLANSWAWNFGDGSTGSGAQVTHTYPHSGTYMVTLIQTNTCGRSDTLTDSVTVSGCVLMNADYSFVSASASHSVVFSNLSFGTQLQYQWDLGDGNTSSLASPMHVYGAPGTYTVCLTVTDTCGVIDTQCYDVVVNCLTMEANYSSAISNDTVSFTNLSSGDVVAWFWNFGDGTTSSLASPVHVYAMPGPYTVCLTTTDACGNNDTHCYPLFLPCGSLAVGFGNFVSNNTVTFSDLSVGSVSAWNWNFGDGNTSSVPSPVHTYLNTGSYNVCLTVTNPCSMAAALCSTVVISCIQPHAQWSFQTNQMTVDFTDLSTSDASAWAWDFGDGNTSSARHPSHTYLANGTYQVCLVISNNCAQDTSCGSITVAGVGMVDPAEVQYLVTPNPSNGWVQIRLQNLFENEVRFVLYDVTGRELEAWVGSVNQGIYSRSWQLPVQRRGMYFLRAQGGDWGKVLPIVVH